MIVETNHPTFGPTRLTTTPMKMRGSKANRARRSWHSTLERRCVIYSDTPISRSMR